MTISVLRTPPTPGPGFDVYWQFAAERQRIYRRRLEGLAGDDLTRDPVLRAHRFTNAYRASDRVSQYLITRVIYDDSRNWLDTFSRVLVFKIFNRIDTWEYLTSQVEEVNVESLLSERLDDALGALPAKRPIYNAAYIMPPPRKGSGSKFRRHLSLLRSMVRDGLPTRMAAAATMEQAFDLLRAYDSIGPFLAYQFLIDLNYTPHLSFSEADHVVAGPGALRGLKKCIADPGDYDTAEVIRWVADQQHRAFEDRGLDWDDLWGRPLQLIDAQNLFCEVDKFTRQAHPGLSVLAPGTRIKQRYVLNPAPMTAWFPPKWGLNGRVVRHLHPTALA